MPNGNPITLKKGVYLHAFSDHSGYAIFDAFTSETLVFRVSVTEPNGKAVSCLYDDNAFELPQDLVEGLMSRGWVESCL